MHESIAILEKELKALKDLNSGEGPLLPNCFLYMKGEFLEYESRQSLKARFPVMEEYANPLRKMQGGFITAAFDNVFGPLSYAAARCHCVTIDLSTQYLRPINPGDHLTISARIVSRSPITMHLAGIAFNEQGKMVATCNANMVVVRTSLKTGTNLRA